MLISSACAHYACNIFLYCSQDHPSKPDNEAHENNDAGADNTAKHVPLAHTQNQEKQEHGGHVPMAHTQDQEKLEHGQPRHQTT